MSEERKEQPRPMTQEELEADAIAAEIAARAEEGKPAPEPQAPKQTPEPQKLEPPKDAPIKESTPAPAETPSVEIEALKSVMAEKDARIAELTKRIRDDDGKRGGELTVMRDQIAKLGDQLRDLMAENRELRHAKPAEPATPPEPDTLETEFPEVAKGVDRRTKPALDEARKASQDAKEAKEKLQRIEESQYQRDYGEFIGKVRTAVPKLDQYNADPDFIEWCKGRNPGSPYPRQATFDECRRVMDAGPVIELFQQWENMRNDTANPQSHGPSKPSKEAQVEVPRSSAAATKGKPQVKGNRIKEIEDKIFKFGTATKEDRLEYERLLDEQAQGSSAA
jgi:hypothetical protein